MTRIDRAFAAFAVVCVALFIWQVATPQGVRVTPTPQVEPFAATGLKWVQLYHGLVVGSILVGINHPLEELYPASDWALFNAKIYAEGRGAGLTTLRVSGVTHWLNASEALPTVDFYCDATRRNGAWSIDVYASEPVFLDLWGSLPY